MVATEHVAEIIPQIDLGLATEDLEDNKTTQICVHEKG